MDVTWYSQLSEREFKEVQFARLYVEKFGHGTSGHLAHTVLAKVSLQLEQATGDKMPSEYPSTPETDRHV